MLNFILPDSLPALYETSGGEIVELTYGFTAFGRTTFTSFNVDSFGTATHPSDTLVRRICRVPAAMSSERRDLTVAVKNSIPPIVHNGSTYKVESTDTLALSSTNPFNFYNIPPGYHLFLTYDGQIILGVKEQGQLYFMSLLNYNKALTEFDKATVLTTDNGYLRRFHKSYGELEDIIVMKLCEWPSELKVPWILSEVAGLNTNVMPYNGYWAICSIQKHGTVKRISDEQWMDKYLAFDMYLSGNWTRNCEEEPLNEYI